MSEKIILYSSAGAAKLVNKDLWLSEKGNYFLTEDSARKDSETHKYCPRCNHLMLKSHYSCTEECELTYLKNKYSKLEKKEWDYETPLFSYCSDDLFFYDQWEINDYCLENDCTIESLMLVWCKKVKVRELNQDIFYDDLPEGCELSDSVLNAIEKLNEAIREEDTGWWEGTNIAAIVEFELYLDNADE